MKQEQLKKLAEWSIDINDIEGESNFYKDDEGDYRFIDYRGIDYEFDPLDSNQLDMLEDKMLDELGVNEIRIYRYDNVDECFRVEYYNYDNVGVADGEGKTKNEARLAAILNYIENK